MTPKEKAKELYIKFYSIPVVKHNKEYHYLIGDVIKSSAKGMKDKTNHIKVCALLCVDEIISACEYNQVETYNTDWWNKVKDEIKQLP